eukprot:11938311-Alexandrium_andersonii.AAC.1
MPVWARGRCHTPRHNSLCQKCRSCGCQRLPPRQPEFDSGRRMQPWVQKDGKDAKVKKPTRLKNEPPPA